MNKSSRRYDEDKALFQRIRQMNEGKTLIKEEAEEQEEKEKSIAITDDPKFGEHVLSNQIDSFRQAVNGGAKFAKPNEDDTESNPLVYFPNTGNLIFSGSIPTLSDLKFQFSLNDVTGSPYIFVDGLALTEEVVTTLNRLRGYYSNWRDQFLAASDMLSDLNKLV